MTNAVIGARGDMARNLLVPLLKQLGPVHLADKKSTGEQWQKIWQADVIWLAVPRNAIPQILKDVKLNPKQLLIDIASLKRRLSSELPNIGAAHLSLHPLHGPYVPLSGQKWAIIKRSKQVLNHLQAKAVLNFLQEQGISFLPECSEDDHDFFMGITLSLPEILTIVLDKLIVKYSVDNGRRVPSREQLLAWAVPASNSLFNAYVHIINTTAPWLRKDLVLEAHGSLLASAKETFRQLADVTDSEIITALKSQHDAVQKLNPEDQSRIKQWIERWFVDVNQRIFSFQNDRSPKPRLVIQEGKNLEQLFVSQNRMTIGIHGIAGSFTHESVMRLCEELKVEQPPLRFSYLIEAGKVIEALNSGKIDLGVIAVANSGSGAYISSMHAISQNNFEISAIYGMEIMQCLIVHPSINSVNEITEVFGHPQAISQCKRTFAEKYPFLKLAAGEDGDDTALCAKRIAQGSLPRTTATLASQTVVDHYDVKVLEFGMHHDPFNTTTFLVIKR